MKDLLKVLKRFRALTKRLLTSPRSYLEESTAKLVPSALGPLLDERLSALERHLQESKILDSDLQREGLAGDELQAKIDIASLLARDLEAALDEVDSRLDTAGGSPGRVEAAFDNYSELIYALLDSIKELLKKHGYLVTVVKELIALVRALTRRSQNKKWPPGNQIF